MQKAAIKPKGFSFSKKQIVGLVIGVAAGVAMYLAPIGGIEPAAQTQLAITLLALAFWACGVLPAPVTGAIYMALILLLGASDAPTVFSGWTNPGGSLWLIIAAFLLAAGVEGTGLARRIAYAISSLKFIKDFRTLIVGVALMELVFALIIPSVFARTFMILVVVQELCKAIGINERDTKVLGLACFALAIPTMIVFLTAEPALNSVVVSFTGMEISWVGWFVQFGIPQLFFLVLMAALLMVVFKPTGEVKIDSMVCREKLAEMGGLSKKEAMMVAWLAIMIVFWLTCSLFGISLAWGTLFLVCAMFCPGINVLDGRALGSIPAGTLIFVTCTMAIGSVGAATGMNEWLANLILPSSFPSSIFLIVLFIAFLSMAVHLIVGSVMATVVVVLPIMLAFNSQMGFGIESAAIVFISFQVLAGHFLLSMHQAPIATGMEKAGFTDKEVLRLGIPLTVAIFIQELVLVGWLFVIGLL